MMPSESPGPSGLTWLATYSSIFAERAASARIACAGATEAGRLPNRLPNSDMPKPFSLFALLHHDVLEQLLPLLAVVEHQRRVDQRERRVERLDLHVGGREIVVDQQRLGVVHHE